MRVAALDRLRVASQRRGRIVAGDEDVAASRDEASLDPGKHGAEERVHGLRKVGRGADDSDQPRLRCLDATFAPDRSLGGLALPPCIAAALLIEDRKDLRGRYPAC